MYKYCLFASRFEKRTRYVLIGQTLAPGWIEAVTAFLPMIDDLGEDRNYYVAPAFNSNLMPSRSPAFDGG